MIYPIFFPLIFRRSFGDNRNSSLLHNLILPLCCAQSLSNPSITLHTELLPLPLSPIKPSTSPRAIEKPILRIFILFLTQLFYRIYFSIAESVILL